MTTLENIALSEQKGTFKLTFYFDVEGEDLPHAHVITLRRGDPIDVFVSTCRLLFNGVTGLLHEDGSGEKVQNSGKISIAKEDSQ